MSAHTDVQHGHDDDEHDHDEGASHATLRGYLTGFVLAAILTIIPFWLVMSGGFEKSSTTAVVVLAFAAVQMIVHVIYFLHMDTKSQGGWNMLALIFTLVLVVITLSGSIWIMYHLNHNMMPSMMQDPRNLP